MTVPQAATPFRASTTDNVRADLVPVPRDGSAASSPQPDQRGVIDGRHAAIMHVGLSAEPLSKGADAPPQLCDRPAVGPPLEDVGSIDDTSSRGSNSGGGSGGEARGEGAVSLAVYRFYLHAVSALMAAVVVVSLVLMQVRMQRSDGAAPEACLLHVSEMAHLS